MKNLRHHQRKNILCKVGISVLAFILLINTNALTAQATDYYPATFHGDAFSNSSQVIVVENPYMSSVNATVTAYQKAGNTWNAVFSNISALVGQNGMQYDSLRQQDTNTTPSGVYGIPFAFGLASNPGTALPYRVADKNSYWDENSGSSTYNRWVEGNPGGENERLAAQPLYKYALVLDYNWNQTPGKGAGIFIHIKPQYYTGGCVGIDESALVSLMKWLTPSANPKVLICTQNDFSKYYYADAIPSGYATIDSPANGQNATDSLTVSGWALAHTGIARVDFYMDDYQWVGSTNTLYARDDVQRLMNANGYYIDSSKCGYRDTFNIHTLSDGRHTIRMAAIANNGTVYWASKQFLSYGGAITDIDAPGAAKVYYNGNIPVSGWVLNRSGQKRVDFYLDNYKWLGSNNGSFSKRQDVQNLINQSNRRSPDGIDSGYGFSIPATSIQPGTHTLRVAGIGRDGSVKWENRTFQVAGSITCLDTPAGAVTGTLRVSGWALNHSGIARVDAYVFDSSRTPHFLGSVPSGALTARSDVQKAFPAYGILNSGYSLAMDTKTLKAGSYTLSVAAIGNDGSVQWAAKTITVASPMTTIDSPAGGAVWSGTATVSGWALNHSGIARVDAYAFDGSGTPHFLGSVPSGALTARPDVQKVFPSYGILNSGYRLSVNAKTLKAGSYTLSVAAIGNDGDVQWATKSISVN